MKVEVRRIGSSDSYWEYKHISKRTVLHFAPSVDVRWVGVESGLVTITTRLTEPVEVAEVAAEEDNRVTIGDYNKEVEQC